VENKRRNKLAGQKTIYSRSVTEREASRERYGDRKLKGGGKTQRETVLTPGFEKKNILKIKRQ
jgi:hypothetical protein